MRTAYLEFEELELPATMSSPSTGNLTAYELQSRVKLTSRRDVWKLSP